MDARWIFIARGQAKVENCMHYYQTYSEVGRQKAHLD